MLCFGAVKAAGSVFNASYCDPGALAFAVSRQLRRKRTVDGVKGLESRLGPHNEAAHVATWGQLHEVGAVGDSCSMHRGIDVAYTMRMYIRGLR